MVQTISTSTYHRLFGPHHLSHLFEKYHLSTEKEREDFTSLWQQMVHHAPFFGCAAHPDIDIHYLDSVWSDHLNKLSLIAKCHGTHEVKAFVVYQFLSALRPSRGLFVKTPGPEVQALVDAGALRFKRIFPESTLPLANMFAYNRSLARHYTLHPGHFAQLVDWTVTLLGWTKAQESSQQSEKQHFTTGTSALSGWSLCGILIPRRVLNDALKASWQDLHNVKATPPPPSKLPQVPSLKKESLQDDALCSFAVDDDPELSFAYLEQDDSFMIEHVEDLVSSIPEDACRCPPWLADIAREHALSTIYGEVEAKLGHDASYYWNRLLTEEINEAGLLPCHAEQVGQKKAFPPLTESALLVHILGLENPSQKAVLSDAVDHILRGCLMSAAKAVGGKDNRHEPVAAYLTSVIAKALRPWSFKAPKLQSVERVILLFTLAELATGKGRKLLHEEKKHAHKHEEPEVLRNAANLALKRWQYHLHASSPRLRVDRVASAFRYLNRIRRGKEPRARDLQIVADMLGASSNAIKVF